MKLFKPGLLLSSLLLSSLASAQQVTFRGKVEDVQGTANQFFLDCTSTGLSSATVNLNAFIGQQVEIDGQWNGSSTAPAVVVDTLTVVLEEFEIGGGAKIGDTSSLSFTATPGDLAIGVLSRASTFVPFPRSNGVFLVDLSKKIMQRTGVVGGTGILEMSFFIPDDPGLLGLEIFGQGALIRAGSIRMTNPDCKTIRS